MKNLFLIVVMAIVAIILCQPTFAQLNSVRFEQLDSLQQAERKPVVVFISTDWCRYCGRMKATTLRDERVVKQLSEKFYFVSLHAEEKGAIQFRGFTFRYKPTGNGTGVHELAEQLGSMNGQLSYPTISVLNPNMEIVYQYAGFLSAKELAHVLSLLRESGGNSKSR